MQVSQLIELLKFAVDGLVRLEQSNPAENMTVSPEMRDALLCMARVGADQDVINLLNLWRVQQ